MTVLGVGATLGSTVGAETLGEGSGALGSSTTSSSADQPSVVSWRRYFPHSVGWLFFSIDHTHVTYPLLKDAGLSMEAVCVPGAVKSRSVSPIKVASAGTSLPLIGFSSV